MNKRSFLGAALAAVVLAVPAPAQDQLAWKFQAGDNFTVQSEMRMKQTVKANVIDRSDDVNMTIIVGFAVKSVSGKEVVLEQSFESAKADGGPQASAVEDALDKLKGVKITFTLDTEKQEVVKIEGVKEVLRKLTEDNPQAAPIMSGILGEDAMKQQVSGLFTFLPAKPVKEGDTWDRTTRTSLGPLGGFKNEEKLTYAGKAEKDGKTLAKITSTTKVTYTTPKEGDPKENPGLPFEIKTADFKAEDMRTTYWFDPSTGRLHSSETKNKLKGTMTLSVAGMELSMEMEQEQEATVKVTAKKTAK
jgi:hypothetical protein